MGLSGIILKKSEDVDIRKLLDITKSAAQLAGLKYMFDSVLHDSMDGGVCSIGSIANTYEDTPEAQQLLTYIYSTDDCLDGFDWVLKNGNLIRAIIFEKIYGREKILLDFLYEYLKLNPEDYFWNEFDWYYTFEDIKKIKQNEFDRYWCYQNPNL